MLAHVDHLGGNARLATFVLRGERRNHLVRPAQDDLELGVGFKRRSNPLEHDAGGVVATHGINSENGSGECCSLVACDGRFAGFPSHGALLSGRCDAPTS